MYSVYTYLIEELRHGNDVKGWFLTFATSHLMRSMNAEAVLKHRVRNEQTSGQKNRRQKVFLFFIFFQPICKFSGRSDKLLAAGAKGLSIVRPARSCSSVPKLETGAPKCRTCQPEE
jgi:hypothetical protein